jgi:hypothetical protein
MAQLKEIPPGAKNYVLIPPTAAKCAGTYGPSL